VRDITDINHPVTVSTLTDIAPRQFVSGSQIAAGLTVMPLSGSPQKVVAVECLGVIGSGWNPSGSALAYVTDDQLRSASTLNLVSGGSNRVVSHMPHFDWGVGCEGQRCADNSDARLLYSPDGSHISLVQTWGGPALRIWTSDGKVLKQIDYPSSIAPTMSVWSGNRFYFRDVNGVERWSGGTESLLLPGVVWIRPKASPAGGQIVYEVRDAYGVPSVDVLDTTSGGVRQIAHLRSEPAFLTARYIWYQGERACLPTDGYPCGSGGTTTTTGKTYLYDLVTGQEAESIITNVWDVWPHPA
jgi:hypothetical protein